MNDLSFFTFCLDNKFRPVLKASSEDGSDYINAVAVAVNFNLLHVLFFGKRMGDFSLTVSILLI